MKQDIMVMLVVAFLCGLFFTQITGGIFGGRVIEGYTPDYPDGLYCRCKDITYRDGSVMPIYSELMQDDQNCDLGCGVVGAPHTNWRSSPPSESVVYPLPDGALLVTLDKYGNFVPPQPKNLPPGWTDVSAGVQGTLYRNDDTGHEQPNWPGTCRGAWTGPKCQTPVQ